MTATFSWARVTPKDDPKHGKPCTRSSHGVSLIQNSARLIIYGGEHVARTPLPASESTWAADLDNQGTWNWRCIECSDGPPERVAHAQAAYGNVVFIFGGRAGITMQEQAMNDLWKLDCSGGAGTEKWSLVTPNLEKGDAAPEERSFHKMICVGQSLYVFGGCSASHGRLADIYRFDIADNTWHNLGASPKLKGRGGANFVPFASGTKLGVVAGFCGEESKDGHMYDLGAGKWDDDDLVSNLEGLRPRSVCVSHSFPSAGVTVVFGGEVDPSAKGHEGAGGFENDVVLLDEKTATYLSSTPAKGEDWPETRGWSDSDGADDGKGEGLLFVFGGLSGDDTNPRRLDDLWCLTVKQA